MPTLQLKISPPQSPQRHQALAQVLTRLTAQHLGKRPEVTAVMIEELPAGDWGYGGQTQLARQQAREKAVALLPRGQVSRPWRRIP